MDTSANRSARLIWLALVSVSLMSAACSRSGSGVIGAAAQVSATAAESSPAAPPSVRASPVASLVAEPPIPEPPAASIAVDGGDPVVGDLGSFTWENGGSGSPWLPGSPIHVGSGERLTLSLAQPVALANWTASRVPSEGLDAFTPIGLGEGTGDPVTFTAPPPGSWSVMVSVWFTDNLGSATYFWRMEVD